MEGEQQAPKLMQNVHMPVIQIKRPGGGEYGGA
jgi:hypothetical protein